MVYTFFQRQKTITALLLIQRKWRLQLKTGITKHVTYKGLDQMSNELKTQS